LTRPYTGEDDSLHPQWIMIDLGAKVDVNAIRIAWANPYARRYAVQFWTGEMEPFYKGITKGTWQQYPLGNITEGRGGTVTLKLVSWMIPVRYPRIWMTESPTPATPWCGQTQLSGIRHQQLYVGTLGRWPFTDVVKHVPSRQQTVTWPSVDP
jgi:hypothetical protein